MNEWTLLFAHRSPPISLNSRQNRWARARLTRDLRAEARYRANNIPPLTLADVTLEWVVVDKRRRDEDNMFATLKPLADGLVDAGIVPDDTPEYMLKACRIVLVPRTEGGYPHLRLRIRGNPV